MPQVSKAASWRQEPQTLDVTLQYEHLQCDHGNKATNTSKNSDLLQAKGQAAAQPMVPGHRQLLTSRLELSEFIHFLFVSGPTKCQWWFLHLREIISSLSLPLEMQVWEISWIMIQFWPSADGIFLRYFHQNKKCLSGNKCYSTTFPLQFQPLHFLLFTEKHSTRENWTKMFRMKNILKGQVINIVHFTSKYVFPSSALFCLVLVWFGFFTEKYPIPVENF